MPRNHASHARHGDVKCFLDGAFSVADGNALEYCRVGEPRMKIIARWVDVNAE